MSYSPILLLHIASGTLGMLSGFVAVFLKKGSRRHGIAGNVFVVAMLLLSSTGAYMGWVKSQPGNVLGGTLTFYLVATTWMTARRAERGTGIMDWGALAFVLVLTAFELTYATEAALSQTGMKYGYPPGPYVMLGSVGLFACIGDVCMLMRGGIAWHLTHRPPSLADVLCAVRCGRIDFPGAATLVPSHSTKNRRARFF